MNAEQFVSVTIHLAVPANVWIGKYGDGDQSPSLFVKDVRNELRDLTLPDGQCEILSIRCEEAWR